MDKKLQLVEFISQDLVAYIMKDKKLSIEDSMKLFYNSEYFKLLTNYDTGLYLYGSLYNYERLKEELN